MQFAPTWVEPHVDQIPPGTHLVAPGPRFQLTRSHPEQGYAKVTLTKTTPTLVIRWLGHTMTQVTSTRSHLSLGVLADHGGGRGNATTAQRSLWLRIPPASPAGAGTLGGAIFSYRGSWKDP